MDMHLRRLIISLFCLIVAIACYGQDIMKPDTCIDMKYYKSYCVIIKDTIRPSYCYYQLSPKTKYGVCNRNGMQFNGNTKHFNYAKTGYDKGHLVPAEDMTYDKNALESTFKWWNCVPQRVKLNRGVWRKEEIRIHNLGKTKNLEVIVGACNYENGIPKYCYKAAFTNGKIVSIFIYNQESYPVTVTSKFLAYIKKTYYNVSKKK